jgi:hypothetical protein
MESLRSYRGPPAAMTRGYSADFVASHPCRRERGKDGAPSSFGLAKFICMHYTVVHEKRSL